MSRDKVLLITGGSRGIGLATANIFKENGYRIVNISRSPIDSRIGKQISLDLSDPRALPKAKQTIIDSVQGTDEICTVHNAAILRKDSIKSSAKQLSAVLQTNVVSAQQLNEIVLPFKKKGSCILYVSSTLGEKSVANSYSYSVSKHANIGQMRATCQDLINTGIHTAAICPGFTDTSMLREHLGNDENMLDSIAKGNSFSRLASAEEIARTLWFCSHSPVINGSVIHANLGQIEH